VLAAKYFVCNDFEPSERVVRAGRHMVAILVSMVPKACRAARDRRGMGVVGEGVLAC